MLFTSGIPGTFTSQEESIMSRSLAATSPRVSSKPGRELRPFWRMAAAAAVVLGPLGITIGRGIIP